MKLTMRKSGERMVTFAIKFHASEKMIDWVASRLGCSRERALKAIRKAYEDDLGSRLTGRALIFDRDAEDADDKIRLWDSDETDELDEDDVWQGGLF